MANDSSPIKFKPVRRVEDFRPVGPVRTTPAEQYMGGPPPRAVLTAETGPRMTGQPWTGMPGAPKSSKQKFIENIAVGGSRYGLPALTAILAPLLTPVAMGVGEFSAREYEDYFGGREYTDSVDRVLATAENIGHGTLAWGMGKTGDAAINALTSRISGKVPSTFQMRRPHRASRLMPKEMRPEVQTAQRFLGRLGKEAEKPLSLTLGTIKRGLSGGRNWAYTLEDIGASGLLSAGIFRRRAMEMPKKEIDEFIKRLSGVMDDFFTLQKRASGPRKFGEFLRSILTKEYSMVDDMTKALYRPYDKMLESTFKTVDGELLQDVFMREAGRYAELIPQILKGTNLAANLDKVLPWRHITLKDAATILRRINRLWGKVSPSEKKILGYIKGHIEPQFNRVLKATEITLDDGAKVSAYAIKKRADAFVAQTRDRLENEMMKSIRKQIDKNPDAVLSMIRDKPESYYALREAFKTGPAGRAFRVDEPTFEAFVRRPLKHDLITKAADPDTGMITGSSLARTIDDDPVFFTEVFGKEAANELRNAATTMRVIQEGTAKGDSVFLKLVQGGELVGIAGGVAAMGAGEEHPWIQRVGAGTFVIFLTPTAAARVFSNQRRLRMMTDGIKAGTKSETFARMMTMLGIQNRQAQVELRKLPQETWEFYNSARNQDLVKSIPSEEEGIPNVPEEEPVVQ